MYKELLPYFESVNDGGEQAQYLSSLGNKETQGGICLHLSITWIYLWSKDQGEAPNRIWQEMKSPAMIEQIANNQRQYLEFHNQNHPYKNIDANVSLATNKFLAVTNVHSVITVNELLDKMNLFSNYDRILYVLYFKEGGAHAVASIKKDANFYLYDPNIGAMTTPLANKEVLLSKIYWLYETKYKMKIERIDIHFIH